MASNPNQISHIRRSILSLLNVNVPYSSSKCLAASLTSRRSIHHSPPLRATNSNSKSAVSCSSFSWDDVIRVSQPEYNPYDSSDLQGFFDKISICNRGSDKHYEFLPFVIEGHSVGYIHKKFFVENLKSFEEVFVLSRDDSLGGHIGNYVTLHPILKSPDDRTRAVGDVIKCLGEKELIPGIRNELYPVTSAFGAPIFFSLERAAAPYFGIKAYGIHMNGYVEIDGKEFLWIGKRSPTKQTFPGMLDHLVAGGLPHGISCGENVIKECEEEAGIPRSMSNSAKPVGAVSYMDIDGDRYKRDVLFCYDLKLPTDFVPNNQDGEVESFRLIPVAHTANVVKRTDFYKPNCSIVIIDFLFRHGFINPDCFGYLDLLRMLKSGDCS